MKLQYYGSEVNVANDAELVITGNSTKAVVESEYKGAVINLDAPRNFEITNKKPNSKLFYATNTTINATDVSEVLTWSQTGGDYEYAPVYFDGGNFTVNFGKICNSKTLATTGDISPNFRLENYGKLSLVGGIL